jgi:putative redox protein
LVMVQIDVEYEGKLRCSAKHEPSGATLLTDAPKDNQGNGEAFSPTDLVATALGTCIVTTMGIVAKRLNVELAGARLRVQKEMIATPTRRIAKLTVEFHGPGHVTEDQRRQLEAVGRACPVYKSLHPDIQTPITFAWGE